MDGIRDADVNRGQLRMAVRYHHINKFELLAFHKIA